MPVQRSLIHIAAAAVAFGAALAVPVPAPAQSRPDCMDVLRTMHSARNRTISGTPDAIRIAKQLGIEPDWVERCAQTYGRRIERREDSDHPRVQTDSELSERREAGEFEEPTREEKQTAGDVFVTIIENDAADRKQLGRVRKEDTLEWEPFETHEWQPNLGHKWTPFLHDDDEPLPGEE